MNGRTHVLLKNWASGRLVLSGEKTWLKPSGSTHCPQPLCSALRGLLRAGWDESRRGGGQCAPAAPPLAGYHSPSLQAQSVGRGRLGGGRPHAQEAASTSGGAVDTGHLWGLAPPTQAPVSSEESARPTSEGAL